MELGVVGFKEKQLLEHFTRIYEPGSVLRTYEAIEQLLRPIYANHNFEIPLDVRNQLINNYQLRKD